MISLSFNLSGDAIPAKIHAMYGRRLTSLNYKELIRKQSVSEVASYLKQQTFYAPVLYEINENLVHRGQLEMTIRRLLFEEYIKLFHYISSEELPFYSFLIKRMEIDEILSCVRFISAGRQGEYIFTLPSFFAKYSEFDLFELAKVKDYGDLLELLKGTGYYDILSVCVPKEGENIDFVKIEFEFNKYYYDSILKIVDSSFSGEERDQIRKSFEMEIDLNNITVILRLRKYFNESGKYIRSMLLPYYFNVTQKELDGIIEAENSQLAWEASCKTFYGKIFNTTKFEFVEKYAQEIMYEYHRRLLSKSMSAPVVTVAYVRLKSNEITNLTSIIEGIRYGLEPAEIAKLLVGIGE